MLESADQALRQKPRQPSIISSVVKSPPLKSSVQKIGSESGEVQASTGDVRTVVHAKSKDSSKHDRRHHHHHHRHTAAAAWGGKHSASHVERNVAGSSEHLLITVTDDERSAVAGEPKHYRSAVSERKESVLDEDQFEPDYDETEMSGEADQHRARKDSAGDDKKKHSRHRQSRHTSSHSDKSKKHKKRKKSKKHKSKSKRPDK